MIGPILPGTPADEHRLAALVRQARLQHAAA
jgi:hypothetical protein